MLLTLVAALALAQEADTPPPPPPPAAEATPAPQAKTKTPPATLDKQTCLTKALSPGEKKSCCRSFPEMCATPN